MLSEYHAKQRSTSDLKTIDVKINKMCVVLVGQQFKTVFIDKIEAVFYFVHIFQEQL